MPKNLPPAVPTDNAGFPPVRFVVTTIGEPADQDSVVVLADGGKFTTLTRPTSHELAQAALAGMNRAESICRFCNGPVGDDICNHCDMQQT